MHRLPPLGPLSPKENVRGSASGPGPTSSKLTALPVASPPPVTVLLIRSAPTAWPALLKLQLTFSPSWRLIVRVLPLADWLPPLRLVTVQTGSSKDRVQPET